MRHHWRTLASCAAALVVVPLLLGGVRIQPYVTSEGVADEVVTQDIAGLVDLFDSSRPHSITIEFDERAYVRMVRAHLADGSKPYIEADITIDGTSLPSVGLRLKGNSTLASLTTSGPPGTLQAAEPEGLPWLIRFDEYVEGRRYQGHREIAVRAGGTGLLLNEALALDLTRHVGHAAPQYAYTTFTVNRRPSTVRLVVEHPDADFAERLPGRGVLYEALATSSFSDQGADPTAYVDDFDQINLRGSHDLQPLIDLVRWVSTSSDDELAAGLSDRVDVHALARYLAMQNLILNYDDIGGPGKNYYLYYALDTKRFTVVGWDYNLAFGGRPDADPHEPVGPVHLHKLKSRAMAAPSFVALYDRAYRELAAAVYGSGRAATTLRSLHDLVSGMRAHDPASLAAEVEGLESALARRSGHLRATGQL